MKTRVRGIHAIVAGFALALLGPAATGQSRPADAPRTGLDRGKIQEVREQLLELMPLKIEAGRLAVDREQWNRPRREKPRDEKLKELVKEYTQRGMNEELARKLAERRLDSGVTTGLRGVVQRLRRAAGSNSHSFSGGGNGWRESFHGGGLSVTVGRTGLSFQVDLAEQSPPHRILNLRAEPKGLHITLVNSDRQCVLLIDQDSDGGFRLLDVRRKEVFRAKADSFAAFCREYDTYYRNRLAPLLRHNGIAPPLTRFSQEVKRRALALLAGPLSDQTAQRARGLIDQLDAASFAAREKAQEKLAEDIARYRWHLREALESGALSAEAKRRAEKLIEQHAPARDPEATVAELGLLDDPAFLVELLSAADNEADRRRVADRLERITGESLGGDPAKWRALLKRRDSEDRQ